MDSGDTRIEKGEIMQLAFVPHNFEECLKFWIKSMGVGPFYVMENLPYTDVSYRGKQIDLDASVALAYWGNMQIEIINQHSSQTSGYTEPNIARRDGLHHILVKSDDVAGLRQVWLNQGAVELMTGEVPGAGRFIYLETGQGGPHVELVELEPRFWKFFDFIRDQATNWDGRDPVRVPPSEDEWSA